MSLNIEQELLVELVDGKLDAAQQQQLAELIEADPQLSNLLVDELRNNDLIARELDPSRVDADFVGSLFTRLDIDLGDGGVDGDGSGDSGPDGSGGEGQGADGQGVDSSGMDGLDVSGLDVSVVDPGSVGAAAGASGGATAGAGATATSGGGILGWALGGVVAVAVGGTAVVMNRPKPPPPPPPFEVVASGDELPPPVVSEIPASADVFVYGRWRTSDGKLPNLDVVQEKWWVDTRTVHVQFDLARLPAQYRHVRLRLYCTSTGADVQPLGIWQAKDEWTEEAPDKALDRREAAKVFAKWQAKAESYWEIDVTDYVRAEQAGDGVISFGIAALVDRQGVSNPEIISFASRENPVASRRPVLLIETSQ